MQKTVFWPCVYEFLALTERSGLEKVILDCGAGGSRPPLALFAEWGYKCTGIDISEDAVKQANEYAIKHSLRMNIQLGDMRRIPFDDSFFSFVYTQNSMCHLNKKDIGVAINEMKRVLRPNGLLFVDFMSIDCSYCNEAVMGKLVGDYEFLGVHGEGEALHSFYRDNEPEQYFADMNLVRRKRVETLNQHEAGMSTDVILWYYLRKPDTEK